MILNKIVMNKSFLTKFRTGTVAAPKTVGVIFDLTDTDYTGLSKWQWSDALTVFKITKKAVEDVHAAAKGKVIFIDRTPEIPEAICFQANGKSAEPAWCGNSYAAVAAYLHRAGCNTKFNVLNASLLSVGANVTIYDEDDFSVTQQWEIEKRFVFNDTLRLFRHRAIFLRFLNDYRVIVSRTIEDFDLCFNRVAKQLSTLRLTDKICLLHPQSGKVIFLTASYIHGAAPVTGLCSLAFLKLKVGWLAERMVSNTVITPRGEEQLPELNIIGNKISIGISNIIVNLQNL
jgi:hypothetical protein